MKLKQDQLYFMRPDVVELLEDQTVLPAFTKAFLDGIKKAGYYEVLNTHFTIQDLMKAGKEVLRSGSRSNKVARDTRVSLYLRFYFNFLNDVLRLPAAYGGHTVDLNGFSSRGRNHDNEIDSDELIVNPHYQTARKSNPKNGRMMRVFCVLERNLPHAWFVLAEQLEITLLELYHPALLKKVVEATLWLLKHQPHSKPMRLRGHQPISRLHGSCTIWPRMSSRRLDGLVRSGARIRAFVVRPP